MLIDADNPASWPSDVAVLLRERVTTMRDGPDGRPHFLAIDDLAAEVGRRLVPHSAMAWHCTRLCPDEIEALRSEGMVPLSPDSLRRRVLRRVEAGDLTPAFAERLMPENLPRFAGRCGRLCFSLTRRSAAAWGCSGALSLWGGEAVFMEHEGGAELNMLLGRLGVPCIIELAVPVPALETGDIALPFVDAFTARHRPESAAPIMAVGCTDRPLGPNAVRRIFTSADPAFAALLAPSYREPS